MSQGKRKSPEQIINCLCEAEVLLSQGQRIPEVCKRLGISPQSNYRYRKEYGGLKVSQAKRLIQGVKFIDGIETVRQRSQAAA